MNCKDDCNGKCGCKTHDSLEKLCFCCGVLMDINTLVEIKSPLGDGYVDFPICGFCDELRKKQIIIKCITCGAYGYIPRTVKSIMLFADSNLHNGIAMVNYCGNCVETKSQDDLPDGVIH